MEPEILNAHAFTYFHLMYFAIGYIVAGAWYRYSLAAIKLIYINKWDMLTPVQWFTFRCVVIIPLFWPALILALVGYVLVPVDD